MSTETTAGRQVRSYWALKRDKVAAAIDASGDTSGYEDRVPSPAERLEDALEAQGLLLMPRATGYGEWRVLIDGQSAPWVGRERPSGPMDAEAAAEAFLLAAAADEGNQRSIVVRPATDAEMVGNAIGIPMDQVPAMASRAPVKVTGFGVEGTPGGVLLRFYSASGPVVMELEGHQRDSLGELLSAMRTRPECGEQATGEDL